MTLFCIISDTKRDIGRKSRFIHTPHSTPALRAPPSEYCHAVWYGKATIVWYPTVKKTLMTCLTVSTEYRRVTDRQTDRRTDILLQYSSRYTWRRAVETDY